MNAPPDTEALRATYASMIYPTPEPSPVTANSQTENINNGARPDLMARNSDEEDEELSEMDSEDFDGRDITTTQQSPNDRGVNQTSSITAAYGLAMQEAGQKAAQQGPVRWHRNNKGKWGASSSPEKTQAPKRAYVKKSVSPFP
jgi:hypothetical protein